MARPKSNKTIISINIDNIVLDKLQTLCRIERLPISQFVNGVLRRTVMTEYDYYRQLAKHHAAETSKYRTLMDTAPDKPN